MESYNSIYFLTNIIKGLNREIVDEDFILIILEDFIKTNKEKYKSLSEIESILSNNKDELNYTKLINEIERTINKLQFINHKDIAKGYDYMEEPLKKIVEDLSKR